jgi:hypothetical protein
VQRRVAEQLCPSAPPEQPGARVIGIVQGSPSEPRVAYLRQALPVVPNVLALAQTLDPREVFRTAAPCAESSCQHFDGTDCTLVSRMVSMVPTAVDELPACPIRRDCRWFHQERGAACERCPQIVTLAYMASQALKDAASPPVNGMPRNET